MSLSFSSSVSGIQAAIKTLDISAHNTANINTDGYKKQLVNLKDNHSGGVVANVTKSTEPGALYKNGTGKMVESSNVNYTNEALAQINARFLLSVNLATIKRTDDAIGSLIDIID
ncbi:MAG: hypothetical protein V3R32_04945 [Nitrosomonadaceae bacterium]